MAGGVPLAATPSRNARTSRGDLSRTTPKRSARSGHSRRRRKCDCTAQGNSDSRPQNAARHVCRLPFHLDSRRPKLPLSVFTEKEARFAMLARAKPEEAARLAALAQEDVDRRRHVYEQMAQVDHSTGDEHTEKEDVE